MREKEEIFNELPFIENFEKDKTDFLLKIGELVEVPKRYVLTKQFEPSHSFYFLIEGLVNFSITVEDRTDEFSVGKSDEKFTPIGWSGFRAPRRYYTTIICEKPCVLFKWSHRNLEKFFGQEPLLGREFLLFVLSKTTNLLKQVRTELAEYNNVNWDIDAGKTGTASQQGKYISVPNPLALMRQSPFFEVFPEKTLRRLAKAVQKKYYLNNEPIFSQGDVSKGIDILAYGKAVLCFSSEETQIAIEESAALHLIKLPGYLVGWMGAAPAAANDVTAVASRNSVIYHISANSLDKILNHDPSTALALAKRLLWLVSIRLRNARAGLISQRYEREILAIGSLIEQNAMQLSVNSPIHKLPHLLNSPLTLDDAFQLLFRLEREGKSLEKELSRLSLDILGKIYKEYNFFEGLRNVYQSVTDAPKSLSTSEIRTMAAKQFKGIFSRIPYVIEGWENLPEESGHLFIYNHLLNYPYNTLPNHFQITLDSHFISAMILYTKYGEAGVRVVRVPRAEEYGHEYYYERLGHINVYTDESDTSKQTPERKKAWREKFYETAGEHLKKGFNIVVSPEGTSMTTEESPGSFKLGAFLLASSIDPEPLIVPIAVANFDKRINHNVFSLIIKKPFRVSDYVKTPEENKNKLFEFVKEYENLYRSYVEEATRAARRVESTKIKLKTFEQVQKELPPIDKNLFEQDVRILERRHVGKKSDATVFYGSSSFRLWRAMARDFPQYDITNLGFGGARIAYCLHYFTRLIKLSGPKSLVFYAGDNDIGDGCLPKQVLNLFLDFYHKFREHYPHTKFTFVSIKPSPVRFHFLDRIEASNDLVRQFLSREDNTFYLNVYDLMLNENRKIREDLFTEDGLHMNRKGYVLWRKLFLANEKEIFYNPTPRESEKQVNFSSKTEIHTQILPRSN
ncbi:MAG: GDSL-type esterase/lipase family protein [Candidatus Dadabacteria bacterium]|nr:GDSL-type esterase/lipase family protein [Candidatus Dadabacteria bacterium]